MLPDLPFNVDLIVEALLASGELARARRVAEGSCVRGGGRLREARGLLSMSAVALAGDPSQWGNAERCIDEVLRVAKSLGARSLRAKGLLLRGKLASLRGEPESRDRDASESAAMFRELGLGRYERQAQALRTDEGDAGK